jgi:GNAT superfamily N-acetyltransferase
MRIEPLEPRHLDAWAALFDAASSPCFCRFWHFASNKNEWLARCAATPRANFDEHAAALRADDPSARGLVALENDDRVCIGWMKLAPRALLPKLRNQSVYRALDLGDGAGVYSVGCFLVHPAHRERGVARRLLAAAPGFARAWGARALEAYPRRTDGRVHAEQAWQGPEAIFVAEGFRVVHGDGPYPVYRKDL